MPPTTLNSEEPDYVAFRVICTKNPIYLKNTSKISKMTPEFQEKPTTSHITGSTIYRHWSLRLPAPDVQHPARCPRMTPRNSPEPSIL